MTELTATYSNAENGWLLEQTVSEPTCYIVELQRAGYVVVKQYDDVEKEWVKVSVSERCTEADYCITTDSERKIRIITSEEPKKIRCQHLSRT